MKTLGNQAREWQFDGLVGPTHNYAGLSFGNLASGKNAGQVSNPRAAALQGIEKMRLVMKLGIPQAVLPPHKRPVVSILQQTPFEGSLSYPAISALIENAWKNAPHLVATAFSSSFMWAANAATVSPSADTADGKLHLTPANLMSNLHRSLEAGWTKNLLQKIFHNEELFKVHNPLPSLETLADEGAANCMLAGSGAGKPAVEIFVYGASGSSVKKPAKFPARQREEASREIARIHGIHSERLIMVQQSPSMIDQGVFHNDVIAMNTNRLLIAQEGAFVDEHKFISQLERIIEEGFHYISISESELPIFDAVGTYLYNSQLLEMQNGEYILIAPSECEHHPKVGAVLARLVEQERVVSKVHYVNVRESMRNGGGPACLRLRVVMTPEESAAIHQGIIMSEALADRLEGWVKRHYRDRLLPSDLCDPRLIPELEAAYAELEEILDLPGLYAGGWV